MKCYRGIAILLCAVFLITSFEPLAVHATTLSEWLQAENEANGKIEFDLSTSETDYDNVRKVYDEKGYQRSGDTIRLTAEHAKEVERTVYNDNENAIISKDDSGDIQFKFYCQTSGLYALKVRYCAMNEVITPIVRSISIDGEIPFTESGAITMYRLWEDDGEPTVNLIGNEVAPRVKQVFDWQTTTIYDEEATQAEPLEWYLEEGEHVLTLSYVENPVALEYLEFYSLSDIPSYKELKEGYEEKGYEIAKKPIYLEAEDNVISKNQSVIRQISSSDPTVSKTEAGKIICNTIGGGLWGDANASITWNFEVEESGLYQIGYHLLQSYNNGLPSYRRIEIDGQVPCEELLSYKFVYNLKWRTELLGEDGEKPYYFYLEKGQHTITMTVTLGEMAEVLNIINEDTVMLSELILQITMLTGQNPDPNYDYRLDERVPGLIESLKKLVSNMDKCTELLQKFSNSKPSLVGQISSCKEQVVELIENPFDIAMNLADLENVLSTYGSAITTLSNQNLCLDNIQFVAHEDDLVKIKGGFFARLWGGLVNFFQSFTKDYDAMGNATLSDTEVTETIEVWVARGTKWGELIQEMADSDFTPKTGIGVEVHVVPAGQLNSGSANTLLLSVSSGTAPDVALGIAANSVSEFAIRNAVVDLSSFDDYEDVIERFQSSLMVPLTYKDAVYGLPETQNFKVLMYRTDILSALGVGIPQTWEDLYNHVLPILYQNNMEFYYPIDADPFVYQCGGIYYNEDMTMSELDSENTFTGIEEFFELYTVYGVPVSANFFNRFRSGEIPMGVGTMAEYMQIRAAAPELKGRWGIALIPGHEQADGTVNHSQGNSISEATMILSQSTKQEESWEFLKWWTSDEVQIQFGNEIEASQGETARWNSANTDAFAAMAWPSEDYKVISEALSQVDHTRVVLGGYFSSRHLNNAFNRTCISGTMNARDSIEQAVKDINKELLRRRESTGN